MKNANRMPRLCCRRRAIFSTSTLGLICLGILAFWLYKDAVNRPTVSAPQPSTVPAMSNPPQGPTVRLTQGTYSGVLLHAGTGGGLPRDIDTWRGIPYGQTTGGENRFRPPVGLPAASAVANGPDADLTVQPATRFGARCPPCDGRTAAAGTHVAGVPGGEDCLNANVYRWSGWEDALAARQPVKKLMPVVVYVHGGAFNTGTGVERNMASFVAWADEPMVGVSFNYRVGALGFLPSSLTAKEGLLNLGLRDQQFLFEWVKNNAEAFGGDPKNITIMGLSAGAHSIGHHLMYYTSENAPFQRAILESGAATARAVFAASHPRHEVQFREFLISAGLGSTPEDQIFTKLRTLPLAAVVAASTAVWNKYEYAVAWPFQPAIDATAGNGTASPANIVPVKPIDAWRQGRGLRVPVLTGFNTNEGTVFVPKNADSGAAFRAFFADLIPAFSAADLDELERLYPDPVADKKSAYATPPPPRGFGRQWRRLDAAYAHFAYICPVLQTAHFLAANSSDAAAFPVYAYHYAAQAGDWSTANHADEAPVVSHDLGILPGAAEGGAMPGTKKLTDAMHGYWARFAATGDPNMRPGSGDGGSLPEWPKFASPFAASFNDPLRKKRDGELGRVMVFGEGNDERARNKRTKPKEGTAARVRPLDADDLRQCEFWWRRVDLSEGLGLRTKPLKL